MKIVKLLLLVLLPLTYTSSRVSVVGTSTPVPTITAAIPTNTAAVVASPTEPVNPTAAVELPSPTLVLPTATGSRGLSDSCSYQTDGTEHKNIPDRLEDNGRSGTLVAAATVRFHHGDYSENTGESCGPPWKAALEKAQFYGESGLYNAIYQSDLQRRSRSSRARRSSI
jgi:hypothetical protein